MLTEAAQRDADVVGALLEETKAAAAELDVDLDAPDMSECKSFIDELEEEPFILVVGGDEGRRPHLERFQSMAKDMGFEGSWIFTGARPPHKTLQEIEDTAQESSAILLHHRAEPEVREEVRKIAAELGIPLRESVWLGAHGVEAEVLRTLGDCAAED
jgi:hypothetical protein